VGVISLIVALALSVMFARSVSRPIVELRDVARALAAGDFSRRPAISAPGEVGELASAVHDLSTQLSERGSTLEGEETYLAALVDSLHEGVVAVDPTRRVVRINGVARTMLDLQLLTPFSADLLPRSRQLRESLAEALAGTTSQTVELALDARHVVLTARPLRNGGAVLALFDITSLRRLEEVRRDFVANVSHELRTPLTIINGFAETLASEDLPPGPRKEFAESIRANAARMSRLVDDLLDLSRIESGGWRPMPTQVRVEDLVKECVAQIGERASAKGLTVNYSIDPDASHAYADPTAFRQMLLNLLANALRYTASGGIAITASSEQGGIRIAVTDTGVGISAEHLPRIFERFYRVHPGRARTEGGTGLGLAIVRHMAEAHGGSVRASSTMGSGTTVSVLFPRQQSGEVAG
jgi:signal transduction histidine kinase